MNDFFNNTATDQHDHAHAGNGHDVDPNDGNKPNSRSKHEKRNQHKQKKESKDMNRIIKNSITPVLAAFAVSMAIIFGLTFDAKGFEANRFNGDNFKNAFVYDNLKPNRLDDDTFANCERIVEAKSNKAADYYGDKNDMFAEDKAVDFNKNMFADVNKGKVTNAIEDKNIGYGDQKLFGIDDGKLADFAENRFADDDKIDCRGQDQAKYNKQNKLGGNYWDLGACFDNEKFDDIAIQV